MVWTRRIPILAAIAMAVLCTNAWTANADTSDDIKELKKANEELKAEVAELKNEIQSLQKDIKRLLGEVSKMRVADKPKKPTRRPTDDKVYDIAIGDSPVKGPKDAPVTIVEFVDVQCRFCIREHPKIEQILKKHGDKIKYVVKHFPLSFHKQAKPAHAALALAKQKSNDAFWKFYDKIMANPKDLSQDTLRGYAKEVGMDIEKLNEAWNDASKMNELLADDLKEARKCNVRGTPSVYINGKKLARRNMENYEERIEEVMKEKK